jgi:hypothetical protein
MNKWQKNYIEKRDFVKVLEADVKKIECAYIVSHELNVEEIVDSVDDVFYEYLDYMKSNHLLDKLDHAEAELRIAENELTKWFKAHYPEAILGYEKIVNVQKISYSPWLVDLALRV